MLQEIFRRSQHRSDRSVQGGPGLQSQFRDLRPREGKLVNGHLVEGPQEMLVVVPGVGTDACGILSPVASEENSGPTKSRLIVSALGRQGNAIGVEKQSHLVRWLSQQFLRQATDGKVLLIVLVGALS